MGSPVGIHQPVQTEVPVMLQLSVISAVPVHRLPVFRDPLVYRMVAPFPDEAPAKARVFFDQFPVLQEISGTVAHGMTVFHQQQRLFRVVLQIRFDLLKGRIHPSDEVDLVKLVFPVFWQIIGTLIGGEPCRVRLLRPPERFLKGASVPALVPHGPDQDAGTVPVPQHHGTHPVQGRLDEGRIIRDPPVGQLHSLRIVVFPEIQRRRAVALIVRFVDHVESHAVVELVKIRDIRIVACPHRVEIVGLDHFQVSAYLFHGHACTRHRVGFMTVDSPEFDGGAVQEDHTVPDADLPEAHMFGDGLLRRFHDQPVQLRCLRGPEQRIPDLQPDIGRI